MKVSSEPDALLAVLRSPVYQFKRIGLEAGPLSQWLFSALAEAGLPVVCVEVRHMRAVLKAQINKTDRNDARGIAQMMRVGLYRPVHVKTLRSQKLRMLLTHRKLLQSKAIAIENDLRGTLRNFGLKVGVVGTMKFEARIKELVENAPDLATLVEPLLVVRRALREQISPWMMLCDIGVVFNSFADAIGLMNRKRSSESRQVLVSFQSTELAASNMPAAVQRNAIAVFCHRFTLRQTLSVPSRRPLAR